MLTVRIERYTQGPLHLPFRDKIAQDFIDICEKKQKLFERDPDHYIKEWRRFKKKAIEDAKALAREQEAKPTLGKGDDWQQRVRTTHAKSPEYWTVKRLAAMVGQTTDEVEAALRG